MVLILDISRKKGQSLLFDLYKAFDSIEFSHKSDYSSTFEKTIFLHAFETFSELPSNISTKVYSDIKNLTPIGQILDANIFMKKKPFVLHTFASNSPNALNLRRAAIWIDIVLRTREIACVRELANIST